MTTPTTKDLAKTLDAIDSLITDWQDWEAEDKTPNPKAAALREQFNAIRPYLTISAPAAPASGQASAISDIIESALNWHSEDADRPDAAPPEWGEAVIPTIEQAPAMLTLLRDAQGAMQSMRHQIDQMSGMFDDADGAIQEACDTHDETSEAIREVLDGLPASPEPVSASVGANHYLVGWEMDVWAELPREAAQKAFAVQQRPDSTANVFSVTDEDGNASTVDLEELVQEVPGMRGPG